MRGVRILRRVPVSAFELPHAARAQAQAGCRLVRAHREVSARGGATGRGLSAAVWLSQPHHDPLAVEQAGAAFEHRLLALGLRAGRGREDLSHRRAGLERGDYARLAEPAAQGRHQGRAAHPAGRLGRAERFVLPEQFLSAAEARGDGARGASRGRGEIFGGCLLRRGLLRHLARRRGGTVRGRGNRQAGHQGGEEQSGAASAHERRVRAGRCAGIVAGPVAEISRRRNEHHPRPAARGGAEERD